jgi:hypothetical protein
MQFSVIKCTVCFSSYKVKSENINCSTLLLDSYTHTNSFYSKLFFARARAHTHTEGFLPQYATVQHIGTFTAGDTLDEYYKFNFTCNQGVRTSTFFFVQESAGIHKYITNRSKLSCGHLLGWLWLTVYKLMDISKQPAASTPSDHTMPLPEDHNSIKLLNNTISKQHNLYISPWSRFSEHVTKYYFNFWYATDLPCICYCSFIMCSILRHSQTYYFVSEYIY